MAAVRRSLSERRGAEENRVARDSRGWRGRDSGRRARALLYGFGVCPVLIPRGACSFERASATAPVLHQQPKSGPMAFHHWKVLGQRHRSVRNGTRGAVMLRIGLSLDTHVSVSTAFTPLLPAE